MQKFVAIHDGSSQSWETVFLAFHVSARLGAALLVLNLPPNGEANSRGAQAEEIMTGGRAAGLEVEVREIEQISADRILEEITEIHALLLPKHLRTHEQMAAELAGGLACPIWLVSRNCEIRRLGAWMQATTQTVGSQYATGLAHRLGQPLIFLAAHSQPPAGLDPEIRWEAVGTVTPNAIEKYVRQDHIDIMFFDAEEAELFRQCLPLLDCILALCPPESWHI